VICDGRVNPDRDPATLGFRFVIGIAADRRGEFRGFRISRSSAGSKVTQVSLNRLTMDALSPAELDWVEGRADELLH
jgi:hypothetical protein